MMKAKLTILLMFTTQAVTEIAATQTQLKSAGQAQGSRNKRALDTSTAAAGKVYHHRGQYLGEAMLALMDSIYSDMNYLFISEGDCGVCRQKPLEMFTISGLRPVVTATKWGDFSCCKPKDKQLFVRIRVRNVYFIVMNKKEDFSILKDITLSDQNRFIAIFLGSEELLTHLTQYIIAHNVFGINILLERKSGAYKIYEACAYCNHGNNSVVYANLWDIRLGFHTPMGLFWGFRESFFGAPLRVAVRISPSFSFVAGKDAEGNKIFDGADVRLFRALSKMMNFKPKLLPAIGNAYGAVVDGVWTGAMGQLERYEVDIAGMVKGLSFQTFQYTESLVVFKQEFFSLVTTKPPFAPKWQAVFITFPPVMWALVFVSLFITSFFYWIITKYDPDEKPVTFDNSLHTMMVILCWDVVFLTNRSLSIYWMTGGYMLGSFVIVSLYMGILIGAMMKPTLARLPIETVDDLRKSGMTTYIVPGSTFTKQLYDSWGIDKPVKLTSIVDGLRKVKNNPNDMAYFFVDSLMLPFIETKGNDDPTNPYHFSHRVPGSRLYLTWHVKKYCVFKPAMDTLLLRAMSAGIYTFKYRPEAIQSMLDNNVIANKIQGVKLPELGGLTLEQMMGGFMVLLLGYAFCILAFVGENVYIKLLNRVSTIEELKNKKLAMAINAEL